MLEVGRDLCLLKIFITHFLRLKQVVFSELGQRLPGFVVKGTDTVTFMHNANEEGQSCFFTW